MELKQKLSESLRDVKDFPKPGIIFKDITPVLKNPELCKELVSVFCKDARTSGVEVVAGIESRGFLFGMLIASELNIPFVPIRKKGKLPYSTLSERYELEYGFAEMEIHTDAIGNDQRVLLHDDVLATGGTMEAASKLIQRSGGTIAGYSFLLSLQFLKGKERLSNYSTNLLSIIDF